MARYFVGLDCGGTRTRAVLVDQRLEILARAAAGPGNPLSAGMSVAARSYRTVLRRLLARAKPEPRDVSAAPPGPLPLRGADAAGTGDAHLRRPASGAGVRPPLAGPRRGGARRRSSGAPAAA